MKKIFIFQLVFIFSLSLNVVAQTTNSDSEKLGSVLKNMQETENNTDNLSVDYREEILYSKNQQREEIEGNLRFLKPKRFLIIQKTRQAGHLAGKTPSQEQKIYINSNIVTIYTPSNKQALIDRWESLISSDFTPITAINFASSWGSMSKTHTLKFVKEEKESNVLELSPKSADWTMTIYISKESNRSSKMIFNGGGIIITISLFNYKINQPMDKKIFDFTPPRGVEVIKLN